MKYCSMQNFHIKRVIVFQQAATFITVELPVISWLKKKENHHKISITL